MTDFRPTASWDNLRLRDSLLRRLRAFFHQRGFLEVETPLLSADTVVDRHLDPIEVRLPGHADRRFWLQTSPEFAMKRLLAAGAPPIFQVTRAFRAEERGPLHNPEFTMVEWYRPGDDMARGMALLSDLAEVLLDRGAAERTSYADAFQQYAGIDPHTATPRELRAVAEHHAIVLPASWDASDRDGLLDLLLVELVQPRLGTGRPTILHDYPASQAALARTRVTRDGHEVAERFELFADGVELANGYHELLDPNELRRRNAENNHLRQTDGKPKLPEESRLLEAMDAGLPASTGVALGLDRVLMIAAGAKHLDDVLPFPIERA